MPLHRPEPLIRPAAEPVDATTPPAAAATLLRDGATLEVTDRYATGVAILSALEALWGPLPTGADHARRQACTRSYRAAALRLLAPVKHHRVGLEGAAQIGFLEELYPDLRRFSLPLLRIQELHGAWERYQAGAHLAVVGQRVHAFYGTYVPTRTEHLELFATWLSQYQGPRERAVDVGTGCGVLAFMLARAGFTRVRATDNNPNAVESVIRDMARRPTPPPIDPVCADLLDGYAEKADLIVMNPPWIKGDTAEFLDRALFFEGDLFERFFDQALGCCAAQGRIVLLFSTILGLLQPEVPHPIEAELARGRLRLVQKLSRKAKPSPGRRTQEKVEVWELAPQ